MAYLLDTNVCVDYLTGRYPAVVDRIRRSSPDDLQLSTIVVAELRYGADHSAHRRTNHGRVDALVAEIDCLEFDLDAPPLTVECARLWRPLASPSGRTTC